MWDGVQRVPGVPGLWAFGVTNTPKISQFLWIWAFEVGKSRIEEGFGRHQSYLGTWNAASIGSFLGKTIRSGLDLASSLAVLFHLCYSNTIGGGFAFSDGAIGNGHNRGCQRNHRRGSSRLRGAHSEYIDCCKTCVDFAMKKASTNRLLYKPYTNHIQTITKAQLRTQRTKVAF